MLASELFVFRFVARWLGNEIGYLIGFAFYWSFWCLLIPWLAMGRRSLVRLFADSAELFSPRNWLAALVWLAVIVTTFLMYGREFLKASSLMIAVALPLAIVNGFCEELLWRGLYVKLFPNNPWLGLVYPSLGFAFWHFAPQSLFPAEDVPGFVLSTLFLGMAYGFIAYRAGSAKWTAISHSLSASVTS